MKILFVAFQFPPRGGAGVHRSINFVKTLPKFGYKPIVFTISSKDVYKMNEIVDESLLLDIPANTEIIRTKSYIPFKFFSFLKRIKLYRLFWFFFYPIFWESSVLWSIFSYKRAKKTIFENNIKLVYTTSGPFSSMILGFLLKRNLKIKWVADLRDPFTEAYFWDFPSKIHWYLGRFFERYFFNKPDYLIVNTEEVKKLYLKRKLVSKNKIKVINNGF